MSGPETTSYRLACMELWGGNRRVLRALELPGLAGWLSSTPLEPATSGGDVHYFSVCNKGVLSRVALADISGHGASASALAQRLASLMRKHIDTWDQCAFMQELHEAFRNGPTGSAYATALVLGYHRLNGQLVFTNAGHLPAMWYRASARRWSWLEDDAGDNQPALADLPLGLIAGTDYRQNAVTLDLDDLLVLYTDGVTEAADASGQQLGRDGLAALARALPVGSPADLGSALLKAVEAHRNGAPRDDDETLLVLQRTAA